MAQVNIGLSIHMPKPHFKLLKFYNIFSYLIGLPPIPFLFQKILAILAHLIIHIQISNSLCRPRKKPC